MINKSDFLLEIGTADLPAKQIDGLVAALATNLEQNLKELTLSFDSIKTYSSPRRLAVLVSGLDNKQSDQPLELRGPPVGMDLAATKFAKTCGVDLSQLTKIEDKKGVFLFYKTIKEGKTTALLLPEVIVNSIKKIPIKRQMRWGQNQGPFIRPVHWIAAIFGNEIIPIEIFGLKASNQTFGHRFLAPQAITITEPKQYETLLTEQGLVIADAEKRKQKIREQITSTTKNGSVIVSEDLLSEVTNLVEWPVALLCSFNPCFLEIPKEVLITTLETQQRYFPIVDDQGKLLPNFVIISNIKSKFPEQVIAGNERVVHARLSDAEYFYNSDRKQSLANNIEKLKAITFQENLGSIYDKTIRLKIISAFIAEKIGTDISRAEKAAALSKCDLVTSMVREFPELQGVMGYYYASLHEDKDVALAIKEQYLPRFSKDTLPTTKEGCVLALADRIDTLVGLFGINKIPTGDKDPFGLRRAAAGILHIILEKNLDLDLKELLEKSCLAYGIFKNNGDIVSQLINFIYDRLRNIYLEQNKNINTFRAILAGNPTNLLDFTQRFEAVDKFSQLPEAGDLIEIYKRISNILDKAKYSDHLIFNPSLATEDAELNAATVTTQKKGKIEALYQNGKYFEILEELLNLKQPLSNLFDKVMVMVEDVNIRHNRLALLKELQDLFMLVADLSFLVSGNKTSA